MDPAVITVFLEYAAILDLQDLPNHGRLSLQAGTTVADLLRRGRVREDQLHTVVAALNDVRRRLDTVLQDGDRLALRLPVGGG